MISKMMNLIIYVVLAITRYQTHIFNDLLPVSDDTLNINDSNPPGIQGTTSLPTEEMYPDTLKDIGSDNEEEEVDDETTAGNTATAPSIYSHI